MKSDQDVISDFNEVVNMTADELEKWLKSDDSRSAGWPKDDDDESVGHDSGRKITEILQKNPDKNPDKYTEAQIQHMRKVVSYCKRHLAQEEKSNAEKSDEEVKQTKSYASLKNWGHDPLKKRHGSKSGSTSKAQESKTKEGDKEEKAATKREKDDSKEEDDDDDNETEEKQAGDKRKKTNGSEESASNKTRKTSQDNQATNGQQKHDGDGDEASGEDDQDDKRNGNKKQQKGNKQKNDGDEDDNEEEESGKGGKEAKNGPKPGDKVSWNWGSGNPQGKVLDVKPHKTSIETKRGNEVSRDGNEEDPAVVLDTGKSKAIKSNHELN